MANKTIINSVIVGLAVLMLDYIVHTFYANPETLYYFLAKPILSGYIAYYMWENKFNLFRLKQNTFPFFLYYSTLFALIHGIYYRSIEIFTNKALFSRVGEITFPFISFEGSLIVLIVGWWVIHGGAYFMGSYIAELLERKKVV